MKHITIKREKHITIKREKDVFNPENMLLGVGVFPAHATRDNESMFYGLTIDEANQLKELIPEGSITGDAPLFSSRQFKFPSELPSGIMLYIDRNIELWVEYAGKRISIMIPGTYNVGQ